MEKCEVYKILADELGLSVPKHIYIMQPSAGILGEVFCAWEDGTERAYKIRNRNGEFILIEV